VLLLIRKIYGALTGHGYYPLIGRHLADSPSWLAG
jgi:hypothetical protein